MHLELVHFLHKGLEEKVMDLVESGGGLIVGRVC